MPQAGSRQPPSTARPRRPDPARADQRPLPGLAHGGASPRRSGREPRGHPDRKPPTNVRRRPRRRRARHGQSGARGRREALRSGVGHRGRRGIGVVLCPIEGARRGRRARHLPRRRDPTPLPRVRARGRFLQPFRRHGARLARSAPRRRRAHALPARVCRRRGGSGDVGGRWPDPARHHLRTRRARDQDLPRTHGVRPRGDAAAARPSCRCPSPPCGSLPPPRKRCPD